MDKRNSGERKKGEMPVSPLVYSSKKKITRGLGLLFFIIGAFFIANAVFSLTGYVSQADEITKGRVSILGLFLEVIGVVLMLIRME